MFYFFLFLGFLIVSGYLGVYYIGRRLGESKVKPTPAIKNFDGREYYPTKSIILFGQHLSQISFFVFLGPIIAVRYGVIESMIWIIAGFTIGILKDYFSMMRNLRGEEDRVEKIFSALLLGFLLSFLGNISEILLNPNIASFFLSFVIITTIGGFVFRKSPQGIQIIASIICVIISLLIGKYFELKLNDKTSYALLTSYIILSSLLPRYVLSFKGFSSSIFIVIFLVFLILGIKTLNFNFKDFYFTYYDFNPIIMFIITCGAVSGLHSIINQNTRKQVLSEVSARKISTISHIIEFLIAIFLIVISSSLKEENPFISFKIISENISDFRFGGVILLISFISTSIGLMRVVLFARNIEKSIALFTFLISFKGSTITNWIMCGIISQGLALLSLVSSSIFSRKLFLITSIFFTIYIIGMRKVFSSISDIYLILSGLIFSITMILSFMKVYYPIKELARGMRNKLKLIK